MFSVSGTFWNCPCRTLALLVPLPHCLLCSCLSFQGPAQSQGFLTASGRSEHVPGPSPPPCACLLAHVSRCMFLILGVGNQVLG